MDVVLDGLFRQDEATGDFLVRHSLPYQAYQLLLTRAQSELALELRVEFKGCLTRGTPEQSGR